MRSEGCLCRLWCASFRNNGGESVHWFQIAGGAAEGEGERWESEAAALGCADAPHAGLRVRAAGRLHVHRLLSLYHRLHAAHGCIHQEQATAPRFGQDEGREIDQCPYNRWC